MPRKEALVSGRDTPNGATTIDATPDCSASSIRGVELAPRLAIGELLNGRYEVERAIGRGGMGWVYAVRDRALSGRLVALKTLGDLGKSAARRSLFKAEFSTMAKLEHPNVARVYDFEALRGSDDLFITMELIEGAPLHRDKKRDWHEIVEIAVQVCRALSYMHSRRIVHFDLKPANILVDGNGIAKVVDFGISGAEPVKRAGHVVGTPAYMAPELSFGGAPADYRADLYSLGITLYQLLFGQVPCPTNDLYKLGSWFNAGGVKVADNPSVLPSWLGRIIEKLCAVEPVARFRNANAVIEAISRGAKRSYDIETVETRQSYIATPRFTGRQTELEQVLRFMRERLAGRGNEPALLVRGISGIGKSRLLLEARRDAQLRGRIFLEANCYERSLEEYGPIAEILYQLVPIVETLGGTDVVRRALPELVKIAPRLSEGRETTASPRAPNAEGERVRLLETTSAFFVEAARLAPFATYVNDLQWAARGPMEILSNLAMRVRDDQTGGQPVRLAILGSYRSDEIEGRPLAGALATLRTEALSIEIELAAFTRSEIESIACSMLGIDAAPDVFVTRLADETGGNAFFVQEVMRTLFENEAVYLQDGCWATRADVGELEIPSSMAELFRRRFALLAEPVKDIVRVLAVHARPMRFELLSHILGDSAPTIEGLRELERRSIVVRLDEKSVSHNIAHDRMRETIYRDLGEAERRSWHARIAEALESLTERFAEKPLDELASHFREAGIRAKALPYSLAAGRRALSIYANEAAVRHLSYAAHEDGARDLATAEDLAEALVRTGDTAACARTLRASLSLAHSASERARVHAALSKCERTAQNLTACIDEGWRAMELLGETRPRGFLSKIVRLCGALIWLVRQNDVPCADDAGSDRARALAHGYGWLAAGHIYLSTEPLLMVYLLITAARHAADAGRCDARAFGRVALGACLGWAGFTRAAVKWLEAARRDAEALNLAEPIAIVMYSEWGCLPAHGTPAADAESKLREGIEWARRGGSSFLPTNLAYYVLEMIRLGQFSAAMEQHTLATSYMRRASAILLDDQVSNAGLSDVLLHLRGDVDAAVARATETIDRARTLNQGTALQIALDHGAGAFVAAHREAEACTMLAESWRRARATRTFLYTRNVFRLLPRLLLENDPSDRSARKRTADVVADGWRLVRNGHLDKLPLVELAQAQLFEAKGKRTKADVFFARALATARQQGVRFYVCDILHQRGVAFAKRGERERAARDLEDARVFSIECGDVYTKKLCEEALAGAR